MLTPFSDSSRYGSGMKHGPSPHRASSHPVRTNEYPSRNHPRLVPLAVCRENDVLGNFVVARWQGRSGKVSVAGGLSTSLQSRHRAAVMSDQEPEYQRQATAYEEGSKRVSDPWIGAVNLHTPTDCDH